MSHKLEIKKRKNGYTIIETMVAISLFLVISIYGMGSLLNADLVHHKSEDMRNVMDNMSFIIEDMSRNIRTGYNFRCFSVGEEIDKRGDPTLDDPRSCPSGGWAIAFDWQNGDPLSPSDQWVYYVSNDNKLFKSTDGATSFIQMTPDEVVVDSVSGFTIFGAEPPNIDDTGDLQQPFMNISLVGKILLKNEIETPFSLQTSVSQRKADI